MIQTAAIVCTDLGYGIGKSNTIPWKHPVDMQYFKDLTTDSVCIMGKNTYESIINYSKKGVVAYQNSLLKNRTCIVISNTLNKCEVTNKDLFFDNTYIMSSMNAAYALAEMYCALHNYKKIFFIGGRKVYLASLKYINKLYLNMILENHCCDTFFPKEMLEIFVHEKSIQLDKNLMAFEYIRDE